MCAKNVNKLFSLSELKHICDMSIEEVFKFSGGVVSGRKGDQHCFIDNGANILAVAHCDTVKETNHFFVIEGDETRVYNTKLDDRLGVYTILRLLPKLGIKVDVLLTENEEIGQSTASDFVTEKKYNWIVEFDRSGENVVTYSYEWDKILATYFQEQRGTFSDICSLEDLGCKGFNVGVGYHKEHMHDCYMIVEEYLRQINRFLRFYNDKKDTLFEHTKTYSRYNNYVGYNLPDVYYNNSYYGNHYGNYWERNRQYRREINDVNKCYCPECMKEMNEKDAMLSNGEYVCPKCFSDLYCYEIEEEYYCPICKKTLKEKELESIDGWDICPECYNEVVKQRGQRYVK